MKTNNDIFQAVGRFLIPLLIILMFSASPSRAQTIGAADGRQWFKADLHTHHTYNEPLKDIIERYRETSYRFLVLSTKDMVQPLDWEKYSDGRMLVVSGVEQSFLTRKNMLGHVIAFRIKVPFRTTDKWTMKEGLEKLKGKNSNVILGINHPNDQRWTTEDVVEAYREGAVLFELNSTNMKHGEFETALWDRALTAGARLYATLVNDVHAMSDVDDYGYVMIRGASLSLKDMIGSLAKGDFYAVEAGCGARPERYEVVESGGVKTLEVSAPGASEIPIVSDNGKVLKTYNAERASYTIAGDETYIRAEIVGVSDRYIFMQPFFLK
jgi:hypothetical protein